MTACAPPCLESSLRDCRQRYRLIQSLNTPSQRALSQRHKPRPAAPFVSSLPKTEMNQRLAWSDTYRASES